MTTGLFVALALAATAAQEQKAIPAFPARAEAVTLDVVVVDKQGRPVRGLTAADFTVLEEGRPQTIVGFEAADLSIALPVTPAAASDGVSSNVNAADSRPGRAFVFVLDDLGLDPIRGMVDTKRAIARWLETKALPSDEVTIVNTSGDVYWSDRVGVGRPDLLAVLERIQGHKLPTSANEWMSDWEAYRIAEFDGTELVDGGRTLMQRLIARWTDSRACVSSVVSDAGDRTCGMRVRGRATELYDRSKRRARALLATVERVSAGLGSWRGRKSILIFSEGFIRDLSLDKTEMAAISASQRGNTAVYFVDARGLVAEGPYGAERRGAPTPREVGSTTTDAIVATAGGEYLAEATGGTMVRDTNDLTQGLDKVLDETSVYYLLGYQPEKAPDGKWRKLTVKVGRPGLKVRSRRGYYASPAVTVAAAGPTEAEELAQSRLLAPSMAVGGERNQILLRLAAHPVGAGEGDLVRVLVGLEVDTAGLEFKTAGASRSAWVELTLASVSRERPKILVLEDKAEILAAQEGGTAPWSFTRELSVPIGVTQLRMQVKDVATGHVGSVRGRVEVRPGWNAVPAVAAEATMPVEVGGGAGEDAGFLTRDLPLLVALESGTVASAFAHQADVLHFEPQGTKRDALLVVSIASDAIDMQLDDTETVFRARLDVAAFVTDAQGRLLTRFRQEWPVERLADNGRLLPGESPVFQQGLRLPPGQLTLFTAVRDTRTGRMSASRRALDVPAAPTTPAGAALSSLVFIDRGEAVPDAAALGQNPLQVEGVRFVPSLRPRVAAGTRELPFLVRVYGAPGAAAPILALEVRQGEKTAVRAVPTLPGADSDGRRTLLGSLPTASLAPGRYEVRVVGGLEPAAAQETAAFEVEALGPDAAATVTARPAVAPAPTTVDPALAAILEKAGEYVVEYGDAFRDIVAEETYTQRAGGKLQNSRSDLVFVSTPGDIPWTCFRDVFEVNGQRVRDREARVEKLFLGESKASAVEKANAIITESARYNFGYARRTINVPTLPLLFLYPANQSRFRFERKGNRRFDDRETVEIALEEIQQPTLVNDGEGGDVPATGRVFVDPKDGTVLRTDITFRFMPNRGIARLAAEYRFDPSVGIWLPEEMKEDYRNLYGTFQPVFRGATEGTARYAKYRRFGVATEERVALPQK